MSETRQGATCVYGFQRKRVSTLCPALGVAGSMAAAVGGHGGEGIIHVPPGGPEALSSSRGSLCRPDIRDSYTDHDSPRFSIWHHPQAHPSDRTSFTTKEEVTPDNSTGVPGRVRELDGHTRNSGCGNLRGGLGHVSGTIPATSTP